ncbi:MAG: stage II sporulation protein P [Oscillospiraceae bacterium]|nr:stage II sporulation protein P [Oscillospiraceae bacterium]
MRRRGFAVPAKPLLIFISVSVFVWTAARFNAASMLASAFSRGLSGEAALILLRAETAPDAPRLPAYGTLLTFGSPLLAAVRPANEGKAPPGGSVMPAQPVPQDPVPPVMTPMLPHESGDGTTPPPPDEPDSESGSPPPPWDDRVWPVPAENDPGALPLHEVTLLPAAPDGGYLTDGSVAVNNDTPYSIDIPALLAREPAQKAPAEGPQILIIHTHASESFLPDERDFYIPTDIERTEDTRYNVVRLGDEMAERLEALGLTVLHDRNINDYPTYSGSYNRTLEAIEGYVKQYPSIQAVFDIHRDSISHKDGTIFKAVCESGYGKTAQMMFVVGTNGTGLPHDGWRDNLSFAAQMQSRLLDACPTLMRPIHLRKERFNQHATPGSLILEVGTAANSLTEALRAVGLFCDAAGPYLADILLDNP